MTWVTLVSSTEASCPGIRVTLMLSDGGAMLGYWLIARMFTPARREPMISAITQCEDWALE